MAHNDRISVNVDNGKYTFAQRYDGSTYALRYGKPWIERYTDIPGVNMVHCMAHELEEARNEIAALKGQILTMGGS